MASGAKIEAAPSCLNGMLDMNVNFPGWDDVHVRRAAAYALDRVDIIEAFGGYAVPDYTLIPPSALRTSPPRRRSTRYSSRYPCTRTTWPRQRPRWPSRPTRTGSVRPCWSTAMATPLTSAKSLPPNWPRSGSRTDQGGTIDAYEVAETGPAGKRQPTFQTGGCIWPDVSGYDFPSAAPTSPPGEFNTADYAPPAVDKLLAAGIATSNPATRFAVYSKLEDRLQADLPYIALYQQDYCIALSKGFTVPHFNELGFMFDDYALQVKPVG